MKVLLTCPNVQFVPGSEKTGPIVDELEALGFRFVERPVPNGSLLYAANTPLVELQTAEDVIELQQRIGLPIKIEDGVLEITS